MQLWRMFSVGAIRFKALAKKGGIGGSGWVSAQDAMNMAAVLAGCRIAFVSTGLDISLLFDTNGHR